MSDLFLKFTVANIRDPSRQQEVEFLVDTGAARAWISEEIARAVGVEPAGIVPLELADGSVTERPYGFCLFVYNGETVAGNVVIGPPGCEPLVGTHVLQDFRMIVDLERHEVTRRRAMRAKRENPHGLGWSLRGIGVKPEACAVSPEGILSSLRRSRSW